MEYIVGGTFLFVAFSHLMNNSQLTNKPEQFLSIDEYTRDDVQNDIAFFDPDLTEKEIKESGAILGDYEWAIQNADPEHESFDFSEFEPMAWYNGPNIPNIESQSYLV
jgi:hypothetical protein